MLCFSRDPGECLVFGDLEEQESGIVVIKRVRGSAVLVCVEAHPSIMVDRGEVALRRLMEKGGSIANERVDRIIREYTKGSLR